ncbi:hypothetical protein, partial [Micromonospora sp. NPDC007230]|uniref:hypothetical protein n=1 Tax=Micromonospora sp. NPDC007230 TaxID=3364237 RepID=UPI00369E53E9
EFDTQMITDELRALHARAGSSSEPRSTSKSPDTQPYEGFTLAYQAATGTLLHACLGNACKASR